MSAAKRGGRVAPPSVFPEWMLKFGSTSAAAGWEILCTQAAGNTRKAWERLVTDPCPVPPTTRQHQLKGKLGTSADGLPLWQYEVTGWRSHLVRGGRRQAHRVPHRGARRPSKSDGVAG